MAAAVAIMNRTPTILAVVLLVLKVALPTTVLSV